MCFDFLYKFFLKNFSLEKELSETLSKICIGLQVKQPFFLSDFKETWIFSTDFEKYSNIILHEPSCSTRAGGRTDRHDDANSRLLQYYKRT